MWQINQRTLRIFQVCIILCIHKNTVLNSSLSKRGFQCCWGNWEKLLARGLIRLLASRARRKYCSQLTDNRECFRHIWFKGGKTKTTTECSSQLLMNKKMRQRMTQCLIVGVHSNQKNYDRLKKKGEKKQALSQSPPHSPLPSLGNNKSIRSNSAGGCIHIPSALVSSKTFGASQLKLH